MQQAANISLEVACVYNFKTPSIGQRRPPPRCKFSWNQITPAFELILWRVKAFIQMAMSPEIQNNCVRTSASTPQRYERLVTSACRGFDWLLTVHHR